MVTLSPRLQWLSRLAAAAALLLPMGLVVHAPPSVTFVNQALAVLLFGAWFTLLGRRWGQPLVQPSAGLKAALGLLAMLGLAALAGSFWAGAAASTGLGTAGVCLAAALACAVGAGAQQRGWQAHVFAAFCAAVLLAAAWNAAAGAIQVFWPDRVDGFWFAKHDVGWRAAGNVRQPNLLSLLLVWALIATAWLAQTRRLPAAAALLGALCAGGVVLLSGSRTGLLLLLGLALWGVWLWRRARLAAAVLWAGALAWALGAAAQWGWARHGGEALSVVQRAGEGAGSATRVHVLRDAWQLAWQHPFTGVGWGEFNLAWTLVPNAQRTQHHWDHAHNLFLQWAVELGWPLTLLCTAALLWALHAAWRAARQDDSLLKPAALAMVLAGALHSQLEYPWWFAHFLLPSALCLGLCLDGGLRPAFAPARTDRTQPLQLAGLGLMLATALFALDYMRVVPVYDPPPDAPPIAQRLADAQGTVLHRSQWAWAASTRQSVGPESVAHSADGAHWQANVPLLWTWARSLHAAGHVDAARFVAARLREFPGKTAQSIFATCATAPAPRPFQCEAPLRTYTRQELAALR